MRQPMLRIPLLLLPTKAIPIPDRSDPHQQDISALKFDALVASDRVEVVDGDDVLGEGVVFDALLLRPRRVVEEDAASGDALVSPVRQPQPRIARMQYIIPRQVLEELARNRRRPVSEPVPLRTLLWVEGVYVVEGGDASEGDDVVLEGRAAEADGVELAQIPVQTCGLAGGDFFHCAQSRIEEKVERGGSRSVLGLDLKRY